MTQGGATVREARRQQGDLAFDPRRRVELGERDVLVYKGVEVEQGVLDAVLNTNKRLLWAFVRSEETGRVMAVPFDESRCVWLQESDMTRLEDMEL